MSPTTERCPDDNEILAQLEGRLAPAALAELERHLQRCVLCAEAMVLLGSGPGSSAVAARSVSWSRDPTLPAEGAAPDWFDPFMAAASQMSALAPGTRIGRFEVRALLGAGGMGVVHAAYDPELRRPVALKLLRSDLELAPDAAAARLLEEAQALARLSHPNVLTAFDVGRQGNHVFIATELVAGAPLDRWIAGERPGWRGILELFIGAGHGLMAAHEAGLVHRDFKPRNVLVGRDRRVRVADFGLATPVPGAAGSDPAAPLHSAVAGTLAYMAPEQLAGRPCDARSDQFSFCVSLYEAIVGHRPFDEKTADAFAERFERAVPAEIPRRAMPRGLAAILSRGLSIDPASRFPSMAEVVAALERVLGRDRRRRLVAAGIAGAIAVAAVTWMVAGSQARSPTETCRADGARRAEATWGAARRTALVAAFAASGRPHAAATADRVQKLLTGHGERWSSRHDDACRATHGSDDPSRMAAGLTLACLDDQLATADALVAALTGRPPAEVVDRAVAAVRALPSSDECADLAALMGRVRRPHDPAVRARIDELEARLRSLEAMLRTGQYAALRAAWQPLAAELETIDFAPLRARGANLEARLFGGLKQAGPAEKASRAAIQQAARAGDDRLAALGWINLIELLGQFEGDLDRALALQPVAEAALARAGDPDDLRADLLDALGNLHRDRGEYREAIELGEQALAAAEKGEQGPLQVARVHNNLALDAERAGQPEVAARHLTRSLALLEGELGPGHPSLAAVLTNLGINAEARGALDAAETYHRRALAIRVETFGKDHPDVATPLENLALLAERRGRSAEGIDSMRRALEIREHAFGEDDRRTADARMNLAALLDQPDQADEAERLILRAEETYRKKLPAGHDVFATVRGALAHVAKRRGDIDRALLLYREGLALARARLGPGHPGLAQWQQDIGLMLHRQGRFEEARVELEAALAAWRKALGPDHPDVAMALLNLGNIERELDQPGRALRHYREAHDIYQKTQDPLMVAFSLEATAAAARLTGDCAEARRAGREALDLFARLLGTEAHEIGLVRDTFGQCALADGEVAAAIAELEAAAVLLVGRDLAVDRAHAGLALAQAHWQAGHRRAAVAAARATLDAVRGHDGADVARARGQVAAWLARHAGPQAPGTTPR